MILALLVITAFALYVMSPEERARLVRIALGAVGQAKDAAMRRRAKPEPLHDALRARTPQVLVTPALILVNVTIFTLMLSGTGALSDPETLVRWGGNFAPRTTNGEWWRLVTAMFVHSGVLHLLANLVGLVQIGLILERLVGHLAFATVYLAAGLLASLASLPGHPVAVSVGASGAIFGVYGLLLASSIWILLRRSNLTLPVTAVKTLGPAAALFILYNVAADGFDHAELAGLVVGFACGLVLTKDVTDRKPSARLLAAAMAATVAIAVASAIPLRGVADVRPEIERVVNLEGRIARIYQTAVEQFRLGAITAEALAHLIDRTIMPELHAARDRLKALDGVPHEHQPLVAEADEYLRLRDESWRLRAEGLHTANMLTLRKAERTEQASLEALERIKPDFAAPVDQK